MAKHILVFFYAPQCIFIFICRHRCNTETAMKYNKKAEVCQLDRKAQRALTTAQGIDSCCAQL